MSVGSMRGAMTRKLVVMMLLGGAISVSAACGEDETNADPGNAPQDMMAPVEQDLGDDLGEVVPDMPEDMSTDEGEDTPDLAPDLGPEEPDAGEDVDMPEDMEADAALDMPEDMEADACGIDTDEDGLTDCEELQLGTNPTRPDTDFDGINDGDEVSIGTDPGSSDTDGDTLTDYEEFIAGTDPLEVDSDGDGLADNEELIFGFDPNNPSTLDSGVLDGDLFIGSACDVPEEEPVFFVTEADGDWRLGLPTVFDNYARLEIPTAMPPVASAVYGDPVNEVAAFVLSTPRTGVDPVNRLVGYRSQIASVATITQDFTSGEFQTHDDFAAAPGQYRLTAPGKTVRKLRDDLLFAFAPFGRPDVTGGLPSSAGNAHNAFVMDVSVIERDDRTLTLVSVAPTSLYDTLDSVKFRMSDLTNTTGVARSNALNDLKCHPFPITTELPTADFYWVLDQSGSMTSYNNVVISFASNFVSEVGNTGIDYRLGVTHMDPTFEGKLRASVGWHTSPQIFANEIDDYVINCSGCDTADEYGLYSAELGIKHMRGANALPYERIRPEAELVTIFMSDEQENALKDDFANPIGRPDGQGGTDVNAIQNIYNNFFAGQTTAYAIYSDSTSCGTDVGDGYSKVALATGGAAASLCAADLTQTISTIIEDTAGRASGFRLPDTPISSTLRVYQGSDDGQVGIWVPRSRTDGFDYFPQRNALAFFGTYRPRAPSKRMCNIDADCPNTTTEQCRAGTCELRNPLQVAVHYSTFRNRGKPVVNP